MNMAYIDYPYYVNLSNIPISDDFPQVAERASDLIDAYTHNATERFSLETEDPALFAKVKKAVAYQIEYIEQVGGLNVWAMSSDDLASKSENFTGYSYNETYRQGSSGTKTLVGNLEVAPLAVSLLSGIVGLGRRTRW
jgi:hypothetical protein